MPRLPAGVLILVLLSGCRGAGPADASGWLLVEKGAYQMVYAPDGKLARLLYDKNADAHADMQILFTPEGRPGSSQTDTDLDGIVDRWEVLDDAGRLAKLGRARRTPGTADAWDVFDATATLTRRELDEDGDGVVDLTDYVAGGVVFLEELDTDHDGRPDRRIFRGPAGELQRVEVTRGGGAWEAESR